MSSIFNISKAISEIMHSDELDDYDAPVKFITPDGTEYLVVDVELETIEETGEQVIWVKGNEE